MVEIVLGLFLIALGIWGVYDEYYYVADLVKGAAPILLMFVGLIATLAGIMTPRIEEDDNA